MTIRFISMLRARSSIHTTLSGCYAVAPDGAEANSVRVFTVNGDEQAEGDLVFFASGSVTDDNLVSFV